MLPSLNMQDVNRLKNESAKKKKKENPSRTNFFKILRLEVLGLI